MCVVLFFMLSLHPNHYNNIKSKYKMALIDNPFDGLGIRYPQAKYGDGNIKQKAFFEHGSHEASLIPFEDRLSIMAKFVFVGYDMHKLVNCYLDEKAAWDDDRRKYGIARSFHIYSVKLTEQFLDKIDKPKQKIQISDNLKRLISELYDKKREPKEETASEEMQRRISEFVCLAKEIYTEPVFLIRANYYDKDANDVEKLIDRLYNENVVSINVTDRKGSDDQYYHDFFDGKIKKQNPKKQYIHRFYQLVNELQSSDVIVIAEYKGKSPKIGLIIKGSTVFCKEEAGEIYKLYCLQMVDVKDITDNRKPFVRSLIPKNLAIGQIIQKRGVIYNMYYGTPIPFELSSVSDSNLEILCAEYLRCCLLFQSVRVLGGTFPAIDIIGYKNQNELFVAQVSRTSITKLIGNKKENLCSFEEAKHKIMFSTLQTDMKTEPLTINIQEVWDFFASEASRKVFLEGLIEH